MGPLYRINNAAIRKRLSLKDVPKIEHSTLDIEHEKMRQRNIRSSTYNNQCSMKKLMEIKSVNLWQYIFLYKFNEAETCFKTKRS